MKYNKITLSGKICTGKSTLFTSLEHLLGWETFSTGKYFREYAKQHNLSINSAQEQEETITKKIDYMVRAKLKKEKHLLVDAWMGGLMAEGVPDVLKVLLICDDPERVKRFAQRERVDIQDAQKEISEREYSLLEKLKKIYNRDDFFDSKQYNLVIDTTHLTAEDVFKMVLEQTV